jgi:hypothetical protein
MTRSKFDLADRAIPGGESEVVSPTSGRIDRILKVREYAAVPSTHRGSENNKTYHRRAKSTRRLLPNEWWHHPKPEGLEHHAASARYDTTYSRARMYFGVLGWTPP